MEIIMNELIYDENPHALSKEEAYILKRIDPYHEEFCLKDECRKIYKKYSEYIYSCDKEKALECIMKVLCDDFNFNESDLDRKFIYRSPEQVSPLALYGTLALKFKRCKNDTLVDP